MNRTTIEKRIAILHKAERNARLAREELEGIANNRLPGLCFQYDDVEAYIDIAITQLQEIKNVH